MEIQNISDREDKSLSWFKLSCKNLYTRIEGCWYLDHFEGRIASFTSLLSRSSTNAQTAPGTKHVHVLYNRE
ncbi:uncharacterized protein DS421_1g07150 [Arachis hypogaea]|nr:uncharacterized protein DS421_1g07150 [Arachis hypogaea]